MSNHGGTKGERQAREVLETWWFDSEGMTYPVDPVIIARKLGINVYKAKMKNSISGYIIKRAPEVAPDIFVNTEHAPVRQRFTVAHELGHYFERKEQGSPANDRYALKRDRLASCGTSQEEINANQFAAELLMPSDLVEDLLGSGLSTMETARTLKVSLESLEHRVRNLRIER